MESTPYPLGPSFVGKGLNFAIYAPQAKEVALYFPHENKTVPVQTRSGDVWHIWLETPKKSVVYQWLIDKALFFDPFSPELESPHTWGAPWYALSKIAPSEFDWQSVAPPRLKSHELIIYETHLRGFTRHPSSKTAHPGTFLAFIEKIPYLLELGVNAVELLPIQEFNEGENPLKNPLTKERLFNYWGYSTVSYFALMNRYANSDAAVEFKTMIRELHRFGIEVIMDVVYNHTYNDEASPYKKLGKEAYYVHEKGELVNDSGCGNTFRADHPVAQELILSSLRRFASEFHVDGFRFDLATLLKRDSEAFVKTLSLDPILSRVKLIAEPWDLSRYEVGSFWPHSDRWSEWNGKYRDLVRSFIKGDPFKKGEFATRLAGSEDLYGNRGNPAVSVNFVTAHDGFSLLDLVSYNTKHNIPNGEKNRDGLNENVSWNCGHEGPTKTKKILDLRLRQQKNFYTALLLSKGLPMLHMGDEIGQTKLGNNNSWCQDNDLSWFRWDLVEEGRELLDYVKALIRIRKGEPLLTEPTFYKADTVEWHGLTPRKPEWEKDDRFLAFSLKKSDGKPTLYVAFNASEHSCEAHLPEGSWTLLLTSGKSHLHPSEKKLSLEPYSSVVLKST